MRKYKLAAFLICITYIIFIFTGCSEPEAIKYSAQEKWELINADGHPRFSDPVSSAQSFWNDSPLVEIHSADNLAYGDDSQKKAIDINFNIGSDENITRIDITVPATETVSIDTLLKTACSYLPKLTILSNSYILDDPYILSTEDDEEYYILRYAGQVSAKYPEIACLISYDTITITRDMPNWIQRETLNGLTHKPWDITIENYFPDVDQKEWKEEQALIEYAKEKVQEEYFE